MQRRTLLALGVASGTLLAAVGAGLSLIRPGLEHGRLTQPGRDVLAAIAGAVLEDALPKDEPAKQLALQAHLGRVDGTIEGLPPHLQAELGELLTVLASAPGRRLLAGLASEWPTASIAELQQALRDMRYSALALRQQVYHALRDLTHAAYFSHADAWAYLGYPGQLSVPAAAKKEGA